jgi:Transmembrane secretion effector
MTSPPAPAPATAPGPAPGPPMPERRASYREVLGQREFRAIFVADIVSLLGTIVAAVALTVLVYQQTRSPALAASVMALSFLPYLAGGLLLGAVADRLPPRRVLVLGDVASAALVAAMLIPGLPVAGMLLLLLGIGLIAPVYSATRSALLPEILPPGPGYVLGRSLLRMVAQSAQIVGYGVGGLLLALLSPRGALAIDVVSFLASAVLLRWGTRHRPARAGRAGSLARDSLAGVRAVLSHRSTRRILLFAWAVPVCEIAPEALATPYATHIGQPARAAGFLMAGMPVGIVLADSLAARVLTTRVQRRIIVPSALMVFAPLAVFAVSPGLPAAVALMVTAGLGAAWVAGLDGLLIDVVPVPLRSRALGVMSAGLMFVQGAGFALWGIAGQYLPPDVVISGAAVLGGAGVLLLRPRVSPGRVVA